MRSDGDGPATPSRRAAPASPGRSNPRVTNPAPVRAPEHRHLPGWVRREYAKARPALADLLALLDGARHDDLERQLDELTDGISAGKFSLAFRYPEVVARGRELYQEQRVEDAERSRVARALEAARRRATARLREAGDLLGSDARSRLQRTLRAAGDVAAIAAVEAEIDQALGSAVNATSRRREREIERTRARIRRSTPRAAPEEPAETWQDVLRRFAEQQVGASSQAE